MQCQFEKEECQRSQVMARHLRHMCLERKTLYTILRTGGAKTGVSRRHGSLPCREGVVQAHPGIDPGNHFVIR